MGNKRDPSKLKAEALKAIDLLAAATAELTKIAESMPDADAKRAELEELSRSIQRSESKGLHVSDELRGRRSSLVSELALSDEAKAAMLEIGKPLDEMRSRFPGLALTIGTIYRRQPIHSGPPFTSSWTLREQIIMALRALGGRARARDVIEWVEKSLEGRLTPRDLETGAWSQIAWRHNARVQRGFMVRVGILREDSPRGIWELITTKDSPLYGRSSGPPTPRATLQELIIAALRAHGGRARMQEVLDWIEKKHEGQFTPRDLQTRATGKIIWRDNAQLQRKKMARDGILRSDSPIGIWELND
ncbi:MAG: hypothetical protein JW759_03410 [Candidatus Coatesbacteria bacterium]|nr:hypothetical protein [Candidatus Coatesbacteria bacterium]